MKKFLSLLIMLAIIFTMVTIPAGISAEDSEKVQAGSVLTLGTYEQDNNSENGAEPIEWKVIKVDEATDNVLVVSKYALDVKPVNDENVETTWEDSSLRSWLNNEFLNAAFSEGEQSYIVTDPENGDQVFLLSSEELLNADYGFSTEKDATDSARQCKATAYAVAQGAWTSDQDDYLGNACWWTRSNGNSGNRFVEVYYDGSLNSSGNIVTTADNCVRPAMWISLLPIEPTPAPTPTPKPVRYIRTNHKPNKTVYEQGEEFDPTGLVLDVFYKDGTMETVPYDELFGLSLSSPNVNLAGTQSIVMTYGGIQARFSIKYGGRSNIRAIKIASKPTKKYYKQGEEFDPTGLVINALNQDLSVNSEIPLSDLTFTGFNNTEEGLITVTAAYMNYYRTGFSVRILNQKYISEYEMFAAKDVYTLNSSLSAKDISANYKYYDGETVTIPFSSLQIEGFDTATEGTKTVTVKYAGNTLGTYDIDVVDAVPTAIPVPKKGDVITFGSYEQDNNTENGTEPIEWIVLSVDKENGKALLFSKYMLECIQYSKHWSRITWESCDLRTWLNDDFMSAAFSKAEKTHILNTKVVNECSPGNSIDAGNDTIDKVYVLSTAELTNTAYGFAGSISTIDQLRFGVPTAHAKAQGCYVSAYVLYQTNGDYWVRNTASTIYDVCFVQYNGTISINNGSEPTHYSFCARPAMWISVG